MGRLPVCTNDSMLVRQHVVENGIKKFNKKKLVEENLTFVGVMSIYKLLNNHLYYWLVYSPHITSGRARHDS